MYVFLKMMQERPKYLGSSANLGKQKGTAEAVP
jgi:hypothetical protein